MEIKNISTNNIENLSVNLSFEETYSIAGLSGSGKTSFCKVIAQESIKRIASILPKADYKFLFGDEISNDLSAINSKKLPLIFFLERPNVGSNPRSTVGTHSGIFKKVREFFAEKYDVQKEVFSFNNSFFWCEKCKGRGTNIGKICEKCNGNRYNHNIDKYIVNLNKKEYKIYDINNMNIYQILELADEMNFSSFEKKIIQNMIKLNIGYITLNRLVSTLSGGEFVRLSLAEFMGYSENCLIIVDEISSGLDAKNLQAVLAELEEMGLRNQIWFIDHSDLVINSANNIIYFGPKSGNEGGKIVSESPRVKPIYYEKQKEEVEDYYILNGLQKRNIKVEKLIIPKNRLITVIGESGVGKSTLVNDCIVPAFKEQYKKNKIKLIGQDRNKSITSKSTITSFLELKAILKYVDKKEEIRKIDIEKCKDVNIRKKIELINELGLGYINLDRAINTLSTGEFQCIHLIAELFSGEEDGNLFIFDEPSKGLSQNIINNFMAVVRKILTDKNITIIMVEHNEYMVQSADYIIDLGSRSTGDINKLECNKYEIYEKNKESIEFKSKIINSKIVLDNGIKVVNEKCDEVYKEYLENFKGTLLKNLSKVGTWIYGEYPSDKIIPLIPIDFEKKLYSENTFLFEVGGLVTRILLQANSKNYNKFDYFNKKNLCKACRGIGSIKTFDFNVIFKDINKGIWDGLIKDDIMVALKKYNYSKIKFLFKEIKKEAKLDLSKGFNDMSNQEKEVFLYGYWNNTFYDTAKKTRREWKGILFLVEKYMKQSKSSEKEKIKETKKVLECPSCAGNILAHDETIYIEGKEIREKLKENLSNNKELLKKIGAGGILDILDNSICLNTDVSTLSVEKQAQLKVWEIYMSSFYGYKFIFKNVKPFETYLKNYIELIAKFNKVIICDYEGISQTKEEILNLYFSKGKIKENSYLYEVLGYSKINTKINQVRKTYPCEYCKGKKVIRQESIIEGIDVLEIECNTCQKTGISKAGLKQIIDGFEVELWLMGGEVNINLNFKYLDLRKKSMLTKIKELNKGELLDVVEYLKERGVLKRGK